MSIEATWNREREKAFFIKPFPWLTFNVIYSVYALLTISKKNERSAMTGMDFLRLRVEQLKFLFSERQPSSQIDC